MLTGGIEKKRIELEDHDPRWADKFTHYAQIIKNALGATALSIEHVGSTSVPGLAAKPIIDIVVVVENSSSEDAYLPAFVAAGYTLRVREPEWHQHRMFRTLGLDVHVHVFSHGCVEVERMLAFRDHLRGAADDRQLYESVKRQLVRRDWPDMNAYAQAKSEIIAEILARAFQTARRPVRADP